MQILILAAFGSLHGVFTHISVQPLRYAQTLIIASEPLILFCFKSWFLFALRL